MTLEIHLSKDLESYVEQKVTDGVYASAAEVVIDALSTQMDHEAKHRDARADIRADLNDAWNEILTGKMHDGPAVVADLRNRIVSRRTSP